MSTTPTGFVCYGVLLSDDEGDFLGTLTDDELYEMEDTLDELGLETHMTGIDSFLGHILAIKGLSTGVDWGGVESISHLRDVEPTDEAISNMKGICDKYEIPFGPDWVVSVRYF